MKGGLGAPAAGYRGKMHERKLLKVAFPDCDWKGGRGINSAQPPRGLLSSSKLTVPCCPLCKSTAASKHLLHVGCRIVMQSPTGGWQEAACNGSPRLSGWVGGTRDLAQLQNSALCWAGGKDGVGLVAIGGDFGAHMTDDQAVIATDL